MQNVPAWVHNSFPGIRIALFVLLVVMAVATVITIFMQPATADGAGAITGQATETYFSKNKKKSMEGTVKKLTIIFASIAAFVAVLFFVTIAIYDPHQITGGPPPAPPTPPTDPAAMLRAMFGY